MNDLLMHSGGAKQPPNTFKDSKDQIWSNCSCNKKDWFQNQAVRSNSREFPAAAISCSLTDIESIKDNEDKGDDFKCLVLTDQSILQNLEISINNNTKQKRQQTLTLEKLKQEVLRIFSALKKSVELWTNQSGWLISGWSGNLIKELTGIENILKFSDETNWKICELKN